MDFFNNSPKKKVRRGVRENVVEKEDYSLTLVEMFDRFITYKQSEGIVKRTLRDYLNHFQYFYNFVGGDLTKNQIEADVFTDYQIAKQGISMGMNRWKVIFNTVTTPAKEDKKNFSATISICIRSGI